MKRQKKGKNVRAESVRKGKEKRIGPIAEINTELVKQGLKGNLQFINPEQLDMTPHERTQHNKTLNRTSEVDIHRAMGLYCRLQIGDKKAYIIFSFYEDHGFALKMPGEYKDNVEGYLDFLQGHNYWVLTVLNSKGILQYANPISIPVLRKYPHRVASENRLIFTMKGSKSLSQKKLIYARLTQPNLFEETPFMKITELVR